MRKNIEIPKGKRDLKYRLFEILPGFISYTAIILLFVLSVIEPVLGAIYLFIIIASTLVKAVGVAYRTVQGYEVIKRAERVDWRQRVEDLSHPHEAYELLHGKESKSYHYSQHLENLKLMAAMPGEYPNPEKTLHVVIVTAYNETIDILRPSIGALKDSTFPNDRIIVALAYEQRGGEEMKNTAEKLHREFKNTFKD